MSADHLSVRYLKKPAACAGQRCRTCRIQPKHFSSSRAAASATYTRRRGAHFPMRKGVAIPVRCIAAKHHHAMQGLQRLQKVLVILIAHFVPVTALRSHNPCLMKIRRVDKMQGVVSVMLLHDLNRMAVLNQHAGEPGPSRRNRGRIAQPILLSGAIAALRVGAQSRTAICGSGRTEPHLRTNSSAPSALYRVVNWLPCKFKFVSGIGREQNRFFQPSALHRIA